MKKEFKGIYAVAVTPFKEDGSFNLEQGKKNIDKLIESGVHGICILGATGEYLSVTNEEHKYYVREIAKHINGRVSTAVGVTRERTDEVVDLIKNAKECGVDAAMVLPPYYCHPSQEEIYEHFKYIMESVDFPIIIYNNPGSAGVDIDDCTFDKLIKLKNTSIIKESTGDIKKLTKVMISAPKDISIFCGCDNMAYESFAVGANGWISMLANLAPKRCVELFNTIHIDKNYEKGLAIYKELLPTLNLLESFDKPVQAIKYILSKQGLDGGFVRRPRMELTAEEKSYIDETIDVSKLY